MPRQDPRSVLCHSTRRSNTLDSNRTNNHNGLVPGARRDRAKDWCARVDINDKVAIVTGAGSGIGRATAMRLAKEGAKVVVAEMDVSAGQETVDLISEAGGEATFVQTDVTVWDDLQRMVETAEQTYGGLDIMYNNAGIGSGRPSFPETDHDMVQRVVEVNLLGVIIGTQVAIEAMTRLGGGVIISTASMGGLNPMPRGPVYAATKAGVVHFTRSLAGLQEERNIRVNCVCPGLVDTPLVQRGRAASPEAGEPDLRPMLQPEDVAEAVVRLINNDGVTGLAMQVRAGQPMRLM